jgi:hypothetical protein
LDRGLKGQAKGAIILLAASVLLCGLSGCGGSGAPLGTITGRVVSLTTGLPIGEFTIEIGVTNRDFQSPDGTFTMTGIGRALTEGAASAQGYEEKTFVIEYDQSGAADVGDVRLAVSAGTDEPPEPSTVRGTVTLSDSNDPSGVTVKVMETADEMVTGSDGTFGFWLPAGSYNVRASKQGYQSQSKKAVLADPNNPVVVDFTLSR